MFALIVLRRQRAKVAAVLALTVLLFVSWTFLVAFRELRSGCFRHLIEYQCACRSRLRSGVGRDGLCARLRPSAN